MLEVVEIFPALGSDIAPSNFKHTNTVFWGTNEYDTIEQATEAAKNQINLFKASL